MTSISLLKLALSVAVLFFGLILIASAGVESNDAVIKALESQAAELSADSFAFDITLQQTVDKSVTTYGFPNEEPIYTHSNGDESTKEVIVISGSEDKLSFRKFKRIYIVLKKNPAQKGQYFIVTALVRDAADQDKNLPKVNVDGKDKVIEWETFDAHLFPLKGVLQLSTFFCVSSFVIPCAFNLSALVPPENFIPSPPFTPKPLTDAADSVKLVQSDNSDSDDIYDLYADLENRIPSNKGRGFGGGCSDPMCLGGAGVGGVAGGLVGGAVGAVGGIVSASVGGAFGIVCGVLGAIFGGCNNAQPVQTETIVVHEQGAPIMGGYPGGYPQGIYPPPGYDPQAAAAAAMGQQMQMMGRRRRRRQAADPSTNRYYIGWKTQFSNPKPGSYLKPNEERNIFYGFGNCPPTTLNSLLDLKNAEGNPEALVDYYLTELRADCLLDRKAVLQKLISDQIISVEGTLLVVNKTNPTLLKSKISLKDTLTLQSACEICAFSHVYQTEWQDFKPLQKFYTPDNAKEISRSVHFLTKLALRYLEVSRIKARHHMIHLSRYLVILLKSAFGKIDQDKQNLNRCPECSEDRIVNANDRLQVIGLLEFVRHGSGPVDHGENPEKAFAQFFEKNSESLQQLVDLFS